MVQPSQPTRCRLSHVARLSQDTLYSLPIPTPKIPSTPDNPSAARPVQIAAQPNVDNTIQGCLCPTCFRARYGHETSQHTTEYQEPPVVRTIYYSITASSSSNLDSSPRSRLSRIRIKPLVVAIHTGWLLLWVASHRHGLSLPNLRLVARSSVVCIRLNSGFRGIKKLPGVHPCMRQWPLQISRSRPLRHLTRLKSLTCRSRSVFGVSLSAM